MFRIDKDHHIHIAAVWEWLRNAMVAQLSHRSASSGKHLSDQTELVTLLENVSRSLVANTKPING